MEDLDRIKNYTVIEYIDKYKNDVKEFLIKIAINEFGFVEWEDYFNEANFLEIDKNKENFWIAIDDNNNVVGTIGISKDRDESIAKLHSLYVRKDYRKNGIATQLYNCSKSFCKKCSYSTIILHTYVQFQEAIKFYKRKGFKESFDIKSKDGIWYYKNIKTENNYRWNDYFANVRNKYNMRVSVKKPLVINLDGKGITRNPYFSLVDNISKDGFLDIMEKSVKYFTRKYNCLSIFGTDEVSFIFENPKLLVNDLNSDMNTKSDEIISMFSQYFFEYFNTINKKEKVFWHGECFSIPYEKIGSYIRYKSGSIKNVLTTYFLKKSNVKDAGRIKLRDKLEQCEKFEYYQNTIKKIENGILYFNGDIIDLEEYLQGNIKIINIPKKVEEDRFLDITKWGIE